MAYRFELNPQPSHPLHPDVLQALTRLAEVLDQHGEPNTRYQVTLEPETELRVDRVLFELAERFAGSPPQARETLIDRIRRQIRSQVGELSHSQMERLVDSALYGVGVQIGLNLGSEDWLESQNAPLTGPHTTPRKRRKIFSCSVCDEVFVDQDSLHRHHCSGCDTMDP